MASPGQSELVPALKQIGAADRALLELCLRHHRTDEEVGELTGRTPEQVKWRRAELIIGIARSTGRSDPSELLAVGEALGSLPAGAWSPEAVAPPLGDGVAPAATPLPGDLLPRERTRPAARPRGMGRGGRAASALQAARRLALLATVLLPAALVLYLSFQSGGFYVGDPAMAALIVIAALLVRVALAERPFEGFGLALGLAAAPLAAFAAWTLGSSAWSDAPGRALVEFDRVLLYLLVLLLAGSVARIEKRVRLMLWGTTLAIVGVCTVALVTRILPDLWSVEPNPADLGLNYPLTYSNALGLLAAVGILLGLHLASDPREPRPVRVLAAAALPALAVTLLLTLALGAMVACAVGGLVYAALGRPRGLLTALVAVGPAVVVALVVSYQTDLLQTPSRPGGGTLEDEHLVALVVALCCAASLLLRALLLPVDKRLARLELPRELRGRVRGGAAAIAVIALIAGGLALQASGWASRQYERFVDKSSIPISDPRARLKDPSNNGRIEFWEVSLDAYGRDPLTGNGAGTYQNLWARHRPNINPAVDGHSLYLEVLGELGIVGLVLIGGTILLILGRLAYLARGPNRAVYAAVLAAASAWALQAGFDWHWEMPAVTLPFFALAGLALAASRPALRAPRRVTRAVVALALVVIAVTPARIAVSQTRLNDSIDAFKNGNCDLAAERALDSIAALDARTEPYELLAYCEAGGKGDRARMAVRTMRQALERDPANWELQYGLAVVLGAARSDPRPAARAALKLNPRGVLPRTAAASFSKARNPDAWERVAGQLQLPVY